jgi:hypothetical protein
MSTIQEQYCQQERLKFEDTEESVPPAGSLQTVVNPQLPLLRPTATAAILTAARRILAGHWNHCLIGKWTPQKKTHQPPSPCLATHLCGPVAAITVALNHLPSHLHCPLDLENWIDYYQQWYCQFQNRKASLPFPSSVCESGPPHRLDLELELELDQLQPLRDFQAAQIKRPFQV